MRHGFLAARRGAGASGKPSPARSACATPKNRARQSQKVGNLGVNLVDYYADNQRFTYVFRLP